MMTIMNIIIIITIVIIIIILVIEAARHGSFEERLRVLSLCVCGVVMVAEFFFFYFTLG